MSLEELKGSMLVERPEEGYPIWDSGWRMKLVGNLEVMVGQLRHVGITQIFVDGSFVEDKDHPNDIDSYFECDIVEFATGPCRGSLEHVSIPSDRQTAFPRPIPNVEYEACVSRRTRR
jgi:hypothetical protein